MFPTSIFLTAWISYAPASVTGSMVKVKLSCALTEHHAMKAYWGSGVKTPRLLTSVLDGVEWSASIPGRFTPREKAPGTHWIGC